MASDSEWRSLDGGTHGKKNQCIGDAADDSSLGSPGHRDWVGDSSGLEHEPQLCRYHSHESESSEACVSSGGTELI